MLPVDLDSPLQSLVTRIAAVDIAIIDAFAIGRGSVGLLTVDNLDHIIAAIDAQGVLRGGSCGRSSSRCARRPRPLLLELVFVNLHLDLLVYQAFLLE